MKDPKIAKALASSVLQGEPALPNTLYVHTFGTLTLEYGGKKIDCVKHRSNLIWSILAYLISNRGTPVSTETLIENVKGSSGNASPSNAMRTAIFRARQMLDELVGPENNRILISQGGGYAWNPEIPTVVDCVEFEGLMERVKKDPTNLSLMLSAFKLYDGKFLSLQSSELWVIPRQVYYHEMYEALLAAMFPLLEKEKKYFDAICACRRLLLINPFSEKTYQHLMRFLLMNNEREEVIKVYKKMSSTMLSDLGVLPNQESRALYHEALSVASAAPAAADEVVQDLGEQAAVKGAYACDYDCFKALYQAHVRAAERSGVPSHVAVVTLQSADGDAAGDPGKAMDALEETLRRSLRRGDAITRCSATQFLVLILAADLENSRRVCARFTAAFRKAQPHSRYTLQCEVRAL